MTLDAVALAEELAAAERDGSWVPLLSERIPTLDRATARAVARARDELRRAAGDAQIGFKLGWTSVAMREALGIERPNWGSLWASQVVDGDLDLGRLHQPKAEPELVAEIGDDGAPARWCLGIEIVNPRFATYDFDQLDNTADNSSCARIRLGPWVELDGDPADVLVELSDGGTLRQGSGANVTGGPTASVAWLRDELVAEDLALRAGDLVFTGGLTAPLDVVAGRSLVARSPSHPQLGELSLRST
ncbi:MAG: hypothetical protein AAFZ07_04200 [Actinomycetota bacterium]